MACNHACAAAVGDKLYQGGIAFPYGTGPEPMYKEYLGKNVYMNLINSAQRYCYITTPYLICDYDLLYALRLAAKKGVDVRLITPGFIHAKNMVCDDKFAICGAINLG